MVPTTMRTTTKRNVWKFFQSGIVYCLLASHQMTTANIAARKIPKSTFTVFSSSSGSKRPPQGQRPPEVGPRATGGQLREEPAPPRPPPRGVQLLQPQVCRRRGGLRRDRPRKRR